MNLTKGYTLVCRKIEILPVDLEKYTLGVNEGVLIVLEYILNVLNPKGVSILLSSCPVIFITNKEYELLHVLFEHTFIF